MKRDTSNISHLQGFTLLEILIAMVLFAIGMLGMTAMQGLAIKDNNDAYMRSRAIFLAYDMGDRIKANPAFWSDLVLNDDLGGALLTATASTVSALTNNYPFCSTDDPPGNPAGTNPIVFCDETELAQYDWYRVQKDISSELPNGALSISKIADPYGVAGEFVIRINITWELTNKSLNNISPSFFYDVRQ